jgi:hypothetical protein
MPNRITKPQLKAAKKAQAQKRAERKRKAGLNRLRSQLSQDSDGAPVPESKPTVRERLFLKKLKKSK